MLENHSAANGPDTSDKPTKCEGESTIEADTDPSQVDIDHLCRVWAEVGQAILARRREDREAS